MSKRTHSEEDIAAFFQKKFNKLPRSQQLRAIEFLQNHPRAVLELDTGAGKSLVAAHQLLRGAEGWEFEKNEIKTVGLYLCYTTDLQAQLARDAEGWSTDDCRVGCLFGRNQYWCPFKIDRALRSHPGFGHTEREMRDYTKRLLDESNTLANQDSSFWYTSHRSAFYEFCTAHDISNTDELWKEISAEGCPCVEDVKRRLIKEKGTIPTDALILENLKCPQGYARISCKQSHVVIVSMALAFVYLKQDIPGLFDNEPLVVIDEAHLLKDASDGILVEELKMPAFNVGEILSTLSDWSRKSGVDDIIVGMNGSYTPEVFRRDLATRNQFASNCEAISFETDEVKKHIQSIRVNPCAAVYAEVLREIDQISERLEAIETLIYTASSEHWFYQTTDPIAERVHTTASMNAEFGKPEYKKAAIDEATKLLTETLTKKLERDKHSKAAFGKVKRIAQTLSINDLLTAAKSVDRLVRAVDGARIACNKEEWMSDEGRKLIVPTALYKLNGSKYPAFTGIEYTPSDGAHARQLARYIWNNTKVKNVLVMSATLCDEHGKLGPFFSEVGIDLADETHPAIESYIGGAAFDKRSIVFYSPSMPPFNNYKPDYNLQCSVVSDVVNRNPRSTLVFGPNISQVLELKRMLAILLPDVEHITHGIERARYSKFLKDGSKAVIYGTNSLSTGVDLPGRLGAVIFAKPYKPKWMTAVRNYTQRYLGEKEFKTLEALYEYRTYRSTVQGAGRLQRIQSDHGWVVMMHDHKGKTMSLSAKLKHRYPSATYATTTPGIPM